MKIGGAIPIAIQFEFYIAARPGTGLRNDAEIF
jgi:hypothetical protein